MIKIKGPGHMRRRGLSAYSAASSTLAVNPTQPRTRSAVNHRSASAQQMNVHTFRLCVVLRTSWLQKQFMDRNAVCNHCNPTRAIRRQGSRCARLCEIVCHLAGTSHVCKGETHAEQCIPCGIRLVEEFECCVAEGKSSVANGLAWHRRQRRRD